MAFNENVVIKVDAGGALTSLNTLTKSLNKAQEASKRLATANRNKLKRLLKDLLYQTQA